MPKPGCGKRSGRKEGTLLEEDASSEDAVVAHDSGNDSKTAAADKMLCNACWFHRADSARSLVARTGATAAGHAGAKELVRAARYGNYGCIELLVEHGVRIADRGDDGGKNACDGLGGTAVNSSRLALLEACEHAHVDVAALLIAHGARVDGQHGVDAVNAACFGVGGRRGVDLVRLLTQHGARVSDAAFYSVLASADEDPYSNTLFDENEGSRCHKLDGRSRKEQSFCKTSNN